MKPTEHHIQAGYFELVRLNLPRCKLIYAVPNGVNMKSPATRMKYWREGRVPGIPDVNIDIARGGYHGMRIEFKRDAKQKASDEQLEAHKQLMLEGYYVELMHDSLMAWEHTKAYLNGEFVRVSLSNVLGHLRLSA